MQSKGIILFGVAFLYAILVSGSVLAQTSWFKSIPCPKGLGFGQNKTYKGGTRLTVQAPNLKSYKGKNTLKSNYRSAPKSALASPSITLGRPSFSGNPKGKPLTAYSLNVKLKPVDSPALGFGPKYKYSGNSSRLTVKGNSPVRTKNELKSFLSGKTVYSYHSGAIQGSSLTVKGNEPVRSKNKLKSFFKKGTVYNFHRSANPDSLKKAPESKKRKRRRIEKAKSQNDLFEPGILKTSKFPRG